MKSTIKTALTISMLLPLAGCFDFGWSKKENKVEKSEKVEAGQHGAAEEKAGKCSHKGCTHDHSKDGHKKSHHHDKEVKVQDMEDEMEDDMDEDMNEDMNEDMDEEVEVQDLEEDAEDMDEEMEEDFN